MSEVLGQDAGLTAEQYHPVIGDPVSDPTPQPEGEVPADVAPVQQAPVVYEIPSWDGQVYKTVTADKVPQVIRDQDTYIKTLRDQLEMYQRTGLQQQPQPQQPTVDSEVETRTAQIRQSMISAGFEDNPQFAKFQAEREIAIRREARGEVQQDFERQQKIAEYQQLVATNPELDISNPLSKAVYEKHKPNTAIEHLALVKLYSGILAQQQAAPQQQAPAPQPQQQLPANVQAMFQPPNRQQQFSRPPATAAAPPRTGGDPPHIAESIRQTLSFLNVTPDSPRGQRAIAEIRASQGGVR